MTPSGNLGVVRVCVFLKLEERGWRKPFRWEGFSICSERFVKIIASLASCQPWYNLHDGQNLMLIQLQR